MVVTFIASDGGDIHSQRWWWHAQPAMTVSFTVSDDSAFHSHTPWRSRPVTFTPRDVHAPWRTVLFQQLRRSAPSPAPWSASSTATRSLVLRAPTGRRRCERVACCAPRSPMGAHALQVSDTLRRHGGRLTRVQTALNSVNFVVQRNTEESKILVRLSCRNVRVFCAYVVSEAGLCRYSLAANAIAVGNVAVVSRLKPN